MHAVRIKFTKRVLNELLYALEIHQKLHLKIIKKFPKTKKIIDHRKREHMVIEGLK